MNKYISFLLVPMMLLGVNGNSCYSMNNTIENNEIQTNKYSQDTILLSDF